MSIKRKCKVKISWLLPDSKKGRLTHTASGSMAEVLAQAKELAMKRAGVKRIQIKVEEAVFCK